MLASPALGHWPNGGLSASDVAFFRLGCKMVYIQCARWWHGVLHVSSLSPWVLSLRRISARLRRHRVSTMYPK